MEEDVGGSGIDVTLGAGIHQQSVADNERHKIEEELFSDSDDSEADDVPKPKPICFEEGVV